MPSRSPWPIIVSPEAEDDLGEMLLDGAITWGEIAARAYGVALVRGLDRLRTFPLLGERTEFAAPNSRRLLFREHVIYYQFDGRAILILRVLHRRQDVPGLT